jgi:membrane protease YdiL (CAAX protease family)
VETVLQRIAATPLRWRLLAVVLVEFGYMTAARIIAANSTTLVEAEIDRTPFRIAAAVLFWMLMRDVMRAPPRPTTSPTQPYLIAVIMLMLATPLLIGGYNQPFYESVILAMTALPVAFAEELFFRGILQNIAIKQWGIPLGLAASVVLFVVFHIGVVRADFFGYAQPALAGLILGIIYLKTGSLPLVIALHAIYDALDSVPRLFAAPDRMWGLALLIPAAAIAILWISNARARRSASA